MGKTESIIGSGLIDSHIEKWIILETKVITIIISNKHYNYSYMNAISYSYICSYSYDYTYMVISYVEIYWNAVL